MQDTYESSLEFMSSEKVRDIGVIASLAVFCVMFIAPVIIVVSSSVRSPPFPAWEIEPRINHNNSPSNFFKV